MSLHISATTALDRLPVAVSGRPPRSIACRSRIRVLRATGEPAISPTLGRWRSGSRSERRMARAAVHADFRTSVTSRPARPRLASLESADSVKSPQPPWLSPPRQSAVRRVNKGAATPPTSTTAAGPRRYAPRWQPPSSALRWNRARACHHPQARAYDGRRRDRGEPTGQGLSIHGAPTRGNAMNLPRRRFLHLAAGVAALPAASRLAWAQAYPTRPIRLVVPFPPGGAFDTLARPWVEQVKPLLGTIIVENIGGGGSSLGAAAVARARPDGYTILLGGTLPHINEALFKSRPLYDPVKDLDPIAGLGVVVFALAVHPSVPAQTLKEFVALRKQCARR